MSGERGQLGVRRLEDRGGVLAPLLDALADRDVAEERERAVAFERVCVRRGRAGEERVLEAPANLVEPVDAAVGA